MPLISPPARLLSALGLHPVLVDVGASVGTPTIWDPIAGHSIYVGFDPDPREMRTPPPSRFFRTEIVPRAVTVERDVDSVHFFFTRSATCSSTLRPDTEALSDLVFADSFEVERETSVPATTIEAALAGLGLDRAHWLKADTQGTDLRLFTSLPEGLRDSVLAVDLEPGLIDAYVGEDLFVETHREMARRRFWLSRLDVHGTVRLRPASLARARELEPRLARDVIERSVRNTPAWVNARYLRSTASLAELGRGAEDSLLLWIFAWLDHQPGFCLDLALDHERRFGKSEISGRMRDEAIDGLRRSGGLGARARAAAPAWLKRFGRAMLGRGRQV